MTSILLLALVRPLSAQTLHVRHDHDPWGACEGELEITSDGVRFTPDEGNHARAWAWRDIQGFDRHSLDEFSLLTYEDVVWRLGQDREFDFTVLPGGTTLDNELFGQISVNVPGGIVDRLASEVEPQYQATVKHLHALGGCEGILEFGNELVVYATTDPDDARTWHRNDIESVWSSGPFDLELRVRDQRMRTSAFRFQLKEPLDPAFYEPLRRSVLLAR